MIRRATSEDAGTIARLFDPILRNGLHVVEFGHGSRNEERVPDVAYEWQP